MNDRRRNYAKVLYALMCGTFLDFYSWSLLQISEQRPNNAFLNSCFSSLSRSFPLQVANLFDDTRGVVSIKKYLNELKKSSLEGDKKLVKNINHLLTTDKDKITRQINRRGTDLAHTNFEVVEEILKKTPQEKRGENSKKSTITKKKTIELLLLAKRIIISIVVHELDKSADPQDKIESIIMEDFKKILGAIPQIPKK